jgi:phosphoglucomutase
MNNAIIEKATKWTQAPFDIDTQNTVQQLINSQESELDESFYKDLEFGTGGLRGIMGVGTNRINKYTIGQTTQGLANYIKQSFPGKELKVAIAHDSRNNSRFFSETAASVLSANGIKVFLFEDLRPTPELSFAVRELGCNAGIVITASHNPKEYNGYKVYWNDGGQLVPPHDNGVIQEVRKVEFNNIQFDEQNSNVEIIGEELDNKYLDRVASLSFNKSADLKIVFTSIHGTGITLVPKALAKVGFTYVSTVKEQDTPDGNFPTVDSPNPEERSALKLAIKKAIAVDADVVLGTDPDADRVGMVAKHNEEFVILNGNQSATLLVYYMLSQWKEAGKLDGKQFIAKTIVTTSLLDEIAESFGVTCVNTLTGFKYIAEEIRNQEGKMQFITGGEESYGYLAGDFVRDKDAVISTVLLCEVAAWAKQQGKSCIDLLSEIYTQFGMYRENLISVTKKGKSGAEDIAAMMQSFRNNPPAALGGSRVSVLMDYQESTSTNLSNNTSEAIKLPKSNVLQFLLDDGSKITARPSGTEPKIKFYFSLKAELSSADEYNAVAQSLDARIDTIASELNLN